MKSIERSYIDVEASEVNSNNDKNLNDSGTKKNHWKCIKKVGLGLVGLAVIGCVAFISNKYVALVQSPEYAIHNIKQAVAYKNTKKLEKFVDLDNISKTVRNETLRNPIYYCKPERLRCENLFAQNYSEDIDIKNIKVCALDKVSGQNNAQGGNSRINALCGYLDIKNFEYVECEELTDAQDQHKVLGLLLQNKRVNEDFVLKVKMEQVPWQNKESLFDKVAVLLKLKQWKITDITNMQDFISELKHTERRKLADLRARTRQELDTSIIASDLVTRLDSEGMLVKDRTVTYQGNFKNTTSRDIRKAQGYFLTAGVGGENNCRYNHNIENLAVNNTTMFSEKYDLESAPNGMLFKKDLTKYYTLPKENRQSIWDKITGFASDIVGKYNETTEKAYHINYATVFVVDEIEFEDGSILKVPEELPEA